MSLIMPGMLVYVQPAENWQNVPSHAVNGEIELDIPMMEDAIDYIPTPVSEAKPDLSAIEISFDIKNQSMTFEPNATFSIDLNERLILSGIVGISVNNQTFRKPFDLEHIIYDMKEDEFTGEKTYYTTGVLKIGNQVWNPISGGLFVYGDSVSNAYFYSHIDHYPD